MSSDSTGIQFVNQVRNTPDFNIFSYRNFYNGGGVAIGDINNDGWQDVFLTSNMGSNKLFLNKGQFKFEDISEKAGITDSLKWSTGVSLVDINEDGWLDIYVCNAGFQKNGDAKNTLYINNHDLTFTEKASDYGLDDNGYTTHAAFFDYDLDGDLDVYILNNSFIPVNTLNYSNARELRAKDWPVKDFLKGGGDKLLRNDGKKFIDVSEEAGIYGSLIGFGLGVTVGDINDDSYPDIYVSNDFFERDYLYINQKNGTFREELENRIHKLSTSSMGADMGDLDNDGHPEIFVTDMLPYKEDRLKKTTSFDSYNTNSLKQKNGFYHQFLQNALQWNDGQGNFVETAFHSGVAASDWSWGALIFDADMDMSQDIFVCNGIYHDVIDQDFIDFFANDIIQDMVMTGKKEQLDSIINKMPSVPIQNVAFKNNGDKTFSNVSDLWGFTEKTFSNGSAYGDLDNDGDADLIINNVNQPSMVYRNNARQQNGNHFIGLDLRAHAPNIFSIGAKCSVFVGNSIQVKEVMPNRGFQSSMDPRLLFSLGDHTNIDSIQIIWSDLTMTTVVKPAIDQYLIIEKSSSHTVIKPKTKNPTSPIFQILDNTFARHEEDEYVDFYYERNIPEMLSKTGPKATMADVNKDGMEDIYICGAAGQTGQLYIGSKSGFIKQNIALFNVFAAWEDTEAIFFDANGDTYPDLFVGSGGNNGVQNAREFQDRLYINDRNGGFYINDKAFPANGYNTSTAIPMDIDMDGDLDLFVGSLSYPGDYGVSPKHFLYINDGTGMFKDIMPETGKFLANYGMIRDAAWTDINNDKKNELIVVGDWGAPTTYYYINKTWVPIKTGLENVTGWWQSLEVEDINGDGWKDVVLGNSGNNGYLQDSRNLPVHMYIKDVDENGSKEKIITRTVKGKEVPVMMKREMVDQLNYLKKKNLKHEDYAQRDIVSLLGDKLNGAQKSTIQESRSMIAYNNQKGGFRMEPLPFRAQLSCINDIMLMDVNNDRKLDIVIASNRHEFIPMFGILDQEGVSIFVQTKDSKFEYVPTSKTGLNIQGVCREILETKHGFLVLRNNQFPVFFQHKVNQ